MRQEDYHKAFTFDGSARDAYDAIARVGEWWTTSFTGSARKTGDVFGVTFGKTRVDFEVIEAVPSRRLVWRVTSCFLDWLKNTAEWEGTKIAWEITEGRNGTTVDMTHIGLVPAAECYKDCESGWNQYVGESLPKLLSTGTGVVFEGSRG